MSGMSFRGDLCRVGFWSRWIHDRLVILREPFLPSRPSMAWATATNVWSIADRLSSRWRLRSLTPSFQESSIRYGSVISLHLPGAALSPRSLDYRSSPADSMVARPSHVLLERPETTDHPTMFGNRGNLEGREACPGDTARPTSTHAHARPGQFGRRGHAPSLQGWLDKVDKGPLKFIYAAKAAWNPELTATGAGSPSQTPRAPPPRRPPTTRPPEWFRSPMGATSSRGRPGFDPATRPPNSPAPR